MDAQRLNFTDDAEPLPMPDDVRELLFSSEQPARNGHVPPVPATNAGIQFFSGPELADLDTRIDWLVDGILVRGQPCLLAGPRKVLKTNIAIDLVISLATGTPFLGQFSVPEAIRVGMMSAESGAATIRETASRIAQSKGFQHGIRDVSSALFAFQTPQVKHGKDCSQFRQIIDDNELELLILDPTYMTFLIGDDGKNIFRMGELLSPLSRIGQDTGCTIILSHHCRKGSGKDGEPLDLGDESFSGFSEWARQWIYLSRRTQYEDNTPGHHELWLKYGGSAGHSGLIGLNVEEGSIFEGGRIWDVEAIDLHEIRRLKAIKGDQKKSSEKTHSEHQYRVRHALESFPDGETKNTIAIKAGLSNGKCQVALMALEESGVVEQLKITKNKKEYDGWKSVGHSDSPSRTGGQSG